MHDAGFLSVRFLRLLSYFSELIVLFDILARTRAQEEAEDTKERICPLLPDPVFSDTMQTADLCLG